MRLASWELSEPQQQLEVDSSSAEQLLEQLQLCSLDPAASSSGSSASLAAAAGQLAALAVDGGRDLQQRIRLQLQLPPELLLETLVAGRGSGQEQLLSAWCPPEGLRSTAAGLFAGGRALQPLVQLLGRAALSGDQRGALLLAAARAATVGANGSAALRFLVDAEAELAVGSSASQSQAAAEQLLWLLNLQAAESAIPSRATASQAAQLLLSARGSSAAIASAVVPAAAQLLLAQQQQRQPGMTSAETAGLLEASQLPWGLSGGGSGSVARLEQELLGGQQQHGGSSLADVQYSVLKSAVAAQPGSAQLWWQWASWLHQLAAQQEATPVSEAATAAAFTASCRTLALAGSCGSGCSALPVLLAVLQLLVQHGSSKALSSDAASQLTAVPAVAWLPLVPQLLSHLSAGGGGTAAQQLLLSLLVHVGMAAPCQVLLPALVAAAGQGLQPAPLQQLLQELRQRQPELAQQLETLTAEAARLAVLPEEHWHTVLQEAAATAAKRLQAQQKQQAAAGGSSSDMPAAAAVDGAGHDAYLAALAPVLLPLQQQVLAAEAAVPETPHELRFQQQHLPRLRQLLQQLLEPLIATGGAVAAASDKQQLQRPVVLLRAAAGELAAALRQKQFALTDVAPALARLTDTGIPIPGAQPGEAGAVTLAGVEADVAVLSTKTRPKRLLFTGSDGHHHAFLLKASTAIRAVGGCHEMTVFLEALFCLAFFVLASLTLPIHPSPAPSIHPCRAGRTSGQTHASCRSCDPAMRRSNLPAVQPPVLPTVWRCTASRSCRWAAGWGWCRCVWVGGCNWLCWRRDKARSARQLGVSLSMQLALRRAPSLPASWLPAVGGGHSAAL